MTGDPFEFARPPRLVVGSPIAQALYRLMAGEKLVVVDGIPARRATAVAARIAAHLLVHRSENSVMWIASDAQAGRRLAGRLRRQYHPTRHDPPIRVFQDGLSYWAAMVNARSRPATRVTSRGQVSTRTADVAVLLPEMVGDYPGVAWSTEGSREPLFSAGQVLLIGPAGPLVREDCAAMAARRNVADWGDMPLEVLLAGAPQ